MASCDLEVGIGGSHCQFGHNTSFGRVRNSRRDRPADQRAHFMTDDQESLQSVDARSSLRPKSLSRLNHGNCRETDRRGSILAAGVEIDVEGGPPFLILADPL